MDTHASLTYRKIHSATKSSLEYPDEIRHSVYEKVFENTKTDVEVFLQDGMMLPCVKSENYERMYKRMDKLNLSLHQIGENLVVNILLVCKAIFREAVSILYENKFFAFNLPNNPEFTALPNTFIKNVRVFEMQADNVFGSSMGVQEDDPYHSPNALSACRHALAHKTSATLWRDIICGQMRLRSLTLGIYNNAPFILLYLHFAKHAKFRSGTTKVFLQMVVDKPNPDLARQARIIKEVSEAKFVPLLEESCIIPAVENFTILFGGIMAESTLLSFDCDECKLVCVKEEDNLEDLSINTCTYEVIWQDNAKKLVSGNK